MNNVLQTVNPHYYYSPIAYHDTWLSIDPIVGCQLNCQYCYMQIVKWTGVKTPQHLYSIPQIVEMLLDHKYFVAHQSVLCFGNQTDIFLPSNIPFALEFLRALETRKLKNPVALITKKLIPENFVQEISRLEYVRPIFFLSYSGLPPEVEKGVNPAENQVNFQLLSKYRLRVIHFWRPLLKVNGTDKILREVLDFVAQYAMASVYTGLRLNPQLNAIYQENSFLKVPQNLAGQYGEYIPPDVEKRLRILAKQKYPDYPLYKHSSCAVSLALSMPDYTGTVYIDSICKGSECPAWKRKVCERSRGIPSEEVVRRLFKRIKRDCEFRFVENAIEIYSEINQEDYAFLLHQLNYPLIARNLQHNLVLRGSILRRAKNETQRETV
jgi:DNA repair photolyase